MWMCCLRRFSSALLVFALCGVPVFLAGITAASAQVVYAAPERIDPLGIPYDESLGTSPSFEVGRGAYGDEPAVRVVERCQYPDGWNSTDFSRDLNGTPAGIGHECHTERGVRARY